MNFNSATTSARANNLTRTAHSWTKSSAWW